MITRRFLLIVLAIALTSIAFGVWATLAVLPLRHTMPADETSPSQGGSKSEDSITTYTFWLTGFTGGLVFATVMLCIATGWLVLEGKRSSDRQLRAYLSATPKLAMNWMNPGFNIGISINLHNHGQTPASHIRYGWGLGSLQAPLPVGFRFPPISVQIDNNQTLFPRETLPFRIFAERPTAAQIAAVETNTERFYVWGVITYEDAFRRTRTTKLSFSFGGQDFAADMRNPTPNHVHSWHWEYGLDHNEAT
jgi:hypothetical protein